MRADNLTGRHRPDVGLSPVRILTYATGGDFRRSDPEDNPRDIGDDYCQQRRAECRLELIEHVKLGLANAIAEREAMPWADIEKSRDEAPMRAVVQVTNEAVLFRRYETAAARELDKTFEYFDALDRADARVGETRRIDLKRRTRRELRYGGFVR